MDVCIYGPVLKGSTLHSYLIQYELTFVLNELVRFCKVVFFCLFVYLFKNPSRDEQASVKLNCRKARILPLLDITMVQHTLSYSAQLKSGSPQSCKGTNNSI